MQPKRRKKLPNDVTEAEPLIKISEQPLEIKSEILDDVPHIKMEPFFGSSSPIGPQMGSLSMVKPLNEEEFKPSCDCFIFNPMDEPDVGPYYVQLGSARSLPELRLLLESRTGVTGNALRIEKAKYVAREGKTSLGCPIAKYIVRRGSNEEKFMAVAKFRIGHTCDNQWMVVSLVAWEGVDRATADKTYEMMAEKVARQGKADQRQCEANTEKTCGCQGIRNKNGGASFSYGCAWSMYYDGCKYANGGLNNINKFKMANPKNPLSGEMNKQVNKLADIMGPMTKRLAPLCYDIMTRDDDGDKMKCRIGTKPGRPFAGITAVNDFCAHAHRDVNNLKNGTTAIITLLKPEHRDVRKPDDEQLHVLPHYAIDTTDEFGSRIDQAQKVSSGILDIINKYDRPQIIREQKIKRQKKSTPSGYRKKFLDKYAKIAKTTNNMQEAVLQAAQEADFANNADTVNALWGKKKSPPRKSTMKRTNYEPSNAMTSTPAEEAPRPPIRRSNRMKADLPLRYQESADDDFDFGNSTPIGKITNMQMEASLLSPISTDPNDSGYATSQSDSSFNASTLQDSFQSQFQSISGSSDDMFQPKALIKQDSSEFLEGTEEERFKTVHNEEKEVLKNYEVGGLAIALGHGSILFEVARQELHATTPLRNPSRINPTRVGIVFYQHKNLGFPFHGYERYLVQCSEKNARDYEAWKCGTFVPTKRKLQLMKEDGYLFPDDVQILGPGQSVDLKTLQPPDLSFLNDPKYKNRQNGGLTPVTIQPYMIKQEIKTEYQPDSFAFDSDIKKEIKMEVKTEIKTEPMTETSSLQIFKIAPQTQALTQIQPEAFEKIIAKSSTTKGTQKLQKAASFPGANVPYQTQWQGMPQNLTPQGFNQTISNYPMQQIRRLADGTIILQPTMQELELGQPHTASNMTKMVSITPENQNIRRKTKISPSTANLSQIQTLPPIFEVTCRGVKAFFHKNLFHSGGVGKCIEFQNQFLLPNEFELRAGSRAKKYKASIFYQDKPLQKLFDVGLLVDKVIRKKFVHDKDVPKIIDKKGL